MSLHSCLVQNIPFDGLIFVGSWSLSWITPLSIDGGWQALICVDSFVARTTGRSVAFLIAFFVPCRRWKRLSRLYRAWTTSSWYARVTLQTYLTSGAWRSPCNCQQHPPVTSLVPGVVVTTRNCILLRRSHALFALAPNKMLLESFYSCWCTVERDALPSKGG